MVYFGSAAFLVCFILRTAVARDEHQFLNPHTDANTTLERNLQCNAAITRFELVNALKDSIISKLPDVIDYDNEKFASGMNIIAKTRSCSRKETVRSVKLEFDDPPRSFCSNQKKGTPFSVFGSTKSAGGKDNYNATLFPLGYRTVKATPYTKKDCNGIPPSKTLSKSFDVKGCIEGIEYYDADTNEMFTGNLANPPCNMNFQVKISDRCQYPVDFVLIVLIDANGQVVARRTSREAPYFLFGNLGTEMKTGFYNVVAYINGKQVFLDTSFTIGGTCTRLLPPTPAPTVTIIGVTVSPTRVAIGGCWEDGSICDEGWTCSNCCSGSSEYWESKAFTACGKKTPAPTDSPTRVAIGGCWEDGSTCDEGWTCSNCCSGSSEYWESKALTACGKERDTPTPAPIIISVTPAPIIISVTVSPTLVATPACESISIQSILVVEDPIFDFGDINVLKLIHEEYQKAELAQLSSSVEVLLPATICADSDDDVSSLGGDAGLASCEKLDFPNDTDVLAFGLEINGEGLCAAINVETDTYALGQIGILPVLSIGSIVTLSLDAVRFSVTKKLSKYTLNNMWDGTKSSPAKINVRGHLVIRGTGLFGFKLSTMVSCTIDINTSLVIDADYLNDGVANIFGNKDDTIDFVVLASGRATPKFTITHANGEIKEIDLGLLIRLDIDTDIYLVVTGRPTELQLAASINVLLRGICDSSPFLGIICEVFDGNSGIIGAVRVYGSENMFGIQFAISGQFAFADEKVNVFMKEALGWNLTGLSLHALFQLQIARDDVRVCATITGTTIDDWCIAKCYGDSDCPPTSFCALNLYCVDRLDDGTDCLVGTTCDLCANRYKFWIGQAAFKCGEEPCWADGSICDEETCSYCCNQARDADGTKCGGGCWLDGTICGTSIGSEGSCDRCCIDSEYWESKALTACGKEPKPCFEDGSICLLGSTCSKCCSGNGEFWFSTALTACGKEPDTPPAPAPTESCWPDNWACDFEGNCRNCCNPPRFDLRPTKCGINCKPDGEFCGFGGCNWCCNTARQDGGTKCGGGCWSDGVTCAIELTSDGSCGFCCNGYQYWESKALTACGTEPCWENGRTCGAGTTCTSCCEPARQDAGTKCGGGCWNDGVNCALGTTCNLCCKPARNGVQCGGNCWGGGTGFFPGFGHNCCHGFTILTCNNKP